MTHEARIRDSYAGVWQQLCRDYFFLTAVALFAVLMFTHLTGVLSRQQTSFFDDYFADPLFLLLAIGAARRRISQIAHIEERRFWNYISVGLLACLSVSAVYLSTSDESMPAVTYLLTDCLYLLFYLMLVLAAETRPHHASGWSTGDPSHLLESTAGVIFAFALLAYFVVIPIATAPAVYATMVPSLLLFLGLDVFLALRFGYFSRTTREPRWRVLYGLFAVTILMVMMHDLREFLTYLRGNSLLRGSIGDLLWYPQFLMLVVTIVAREYLPVGRMTESAEEEETESQGAGYRSVGPLIFYAFAFPLMHIVAEMLGWLENSGNSIRHMMVMAYMVAMGALAMAQHALLRRRNRVLFADLRRAQERLQQGRKMEALGRLAGGVAHDFNNLLGVIIGYSELLLDRPEDTPLVRRYAAQIKTAGERAAVFTSQLLTFSRKQVVQAKVVHLDAVVNELDQRLRKLLGANVVMNIRLRAVPGRVKVDPSQLSLVILNLASNARDAMPHGGEFTLETFNTFLEGSKTMNLPGVAPGPYICLSLSDTGRGMDAETQAHLFEPFFSTKRDAVGAGLGLSTVYGIIRQCGGHVEVSSAPNKGTTVFLYFPYVEDTPTQRPVSEPKQARQGGTETILLVEDEASLRQLSREFLGSLGYVVLEASDANVALNVVAQYPGTIHLLLTDVILPGIGGRELALRLLAEHPNMKVLFVSGYTGEAVFDAREFRSGLAFLQKPYTLNALAKRIREVLESSGGVFIEGVRR